MFFFQKKKEFLGQDCLNMNVWFVFFFYFLRYLFDEPPVGDCTSVVFGSDMKFMKMRTKYEMEDLVNHHKKRLFIKL